MKKYSSIYCGFSEVKSQRIREETILLGELLAKNNIGIIYGGSSHGLMGLIADGALKAQGEVIGVMPLFLKEIEGIHPNLSKLEYVNSLTERKQRFAELGDAYIALPGGLGTLDELSETWINAKLSKIVKPICLFNIENYYDPFLSFIDNMVQQNLLTEPDRNLVSVFTDAQALVNFLK